MKLETIYNELVSIMKDNMNFTKALALKEKLEKAIREETCYKTTSKTRVNAIKRVASKMLDRPALTGYGEQEGYKIVTDSYHAIMIKQDEMPLKLVTTDSELATKVGKENCIFGTYPNFTHFINFDKEQHDIVNLDLNDIETFYKLHKKNAKEELYEINGHYYNIIFIKNVLDVLGTDITFYLPKENYRPAYMVNKDNEIGLVLPIAKY